MALVSMGNVTVTLQEVASREGSAAGAYVWFFVRIYSYSVRVITARFCGGLAAYEFGYVVGDAHGGESAVYNWGKPVTSLGLMCSRQL